jgi:hypothetical protein
MDLECVQQLQWTNLMSGLRAKLWGIELHVGESWISHFLLMWVTVVNTSSYHGSLRADFDDM